MTMLAIRMFLGGALSKLWAWLSHRSFWQIVCMALAAFALVQHFQLADARHDRDSYRSQRDEYKRQLDAISSKRNEQKATTAERIKVVTRTIHDADERAKVVEKALPPGDCKTNAQVMGADL
jgi:hypothetical protein